ncbi:protein of unknown function [Taphrina deformans PYCC 5710]|uniref:SAP domain-containing protein n=1 Tax=Taphrina deformans (strain PYCC 5710 / ATCC 11124 / CBS 356.35 / IMI 108563 / JCM 9778 / NBRC 8474) TaxID=1097556 RepID=R4XGM8_TAPDE|nr:protein of unknown function [Taphrina deformans PYCC 5710]|eukprot:CCG84951.1 protein of unknown function [Taphrina deformans PYCC 5710]
MSLRTYKKSELKEMCQRLSLAADGLKNELEDRLQNYLDQSGKLIEDIPELADHFIDLPVSPSTAKKAARKSLALLSEEESDLEHKASDLVKPLNRRLQQAAHDTEVSPTKVAQWAHDTRKQVLSSKNVPKVFSKTIPDTVGSIRSSMSQVKTVAIISVIVEGLKMDKALIPISYEVKYGGYRSITVPDILVLLSGENYWKPIFTWLSFQIIPLVAAFVFNFRAHSTSRRGRKANVEYSFDPFTFALSKLLLIYLAFHTSLGSYYAWKELGLVQHIVGNETFVIGSVVTLFYAIYDALL